MAEHEEGRLVAAQAQVQEKFEHGNAYNIFILVLTIQSLAIMALLLLPLDEATTNALIREMGGSIPADVTMPAFPPLRARFDAMTRECVQSHVPSSVADGASFHLCGCRGG